MRGREYSSRSLTVSFPTSSRRSSDASRRCATCHVTGRADRDRNACVSRRWALPSPSPLRPGGARARVFQGAAAVAALPSRQPRGLSPLQSHPAEVRPNRPSRRSSAGFHSRHPASTPVPRDGGQPEGLVLLAAARSRRNTAPPNDTVLAMMPLLITSYVGSLITLPGWRRLHRIDARCPRRIERVRFGSLRRAGDQLRRRGLAGLSKRRMRPKHQSVDKIVEIKASSSTPFLERCRRSTRRCIQLQARGAGGRPDREGSSARRRPGARSRWTPPWDPARVDVIDTGARSPSVGADARPPLQRARRDDRRGETIAADTERWPITATSDVPSRWSRRWRSRDGIKVIDLVAPFVRRQGRSFGGAGLGKTVLSRS